MNLHGLASGAIAAVNPFVPLTWKASIGYTTNADGTRTPNYAAPVTVMGQVQALQYRDIQQIDGLNLQGTRRKIYFYGEVDGLVRSLSKGGDLILDGQGNTWLVAMVLEQWPDWCSVAVTLQNGV